MRELLAAGRRPVRDVWLSDTVDEGDVIGEILDLAEDAGVPVRRVSRARIDAEARSDAAQGVLAHARELTEADLDALCRTAADGTRPFLLVVDGVTDPHNLGALLRSAELAGAIEYLPIAVVAGIPSALVTLRAKAVWTVGLDPEGDRSVYDLDLGSEAVALVVGAEGAGLSHLARARCDVGVSIPQRGHLGSLNVSAAGAVALFEIARRRG